jgi:hypothetical protein
VLDSRFALVCRVFGDLLYSTWRLTFVKAILCQCVAAIQWHAKARGDSAHAGAAAKKSRSDADYEKTVAPCGGSGLACIRGIHGLTPEAKGVPPLSGLRRTSKPHAPGQQRQTRRGLGKKADRSPLP